MNEKNKSFVRTVSLTRPSLQDNTADADRLVSVLKSELQTDTVKIDFPLLKRLPDLLRKWEYHVRCVLVPCPNGGEWLLTGITDAQDTKPVTGLAVDLGTTRVVLRLLDLSTGQALAESSFDNPQISVGPDILARIHYADTEEGLEKISHLITDGINHEMAALCKSCELGPENVFLLSVAGNTAMTHLLWG